MKVLIYTESFFPTSGGIQTVVNELARGLARWPPEESGGNAFEVTVATRTAERTERDAQFPFRLVRAPTPRALFRAIRESDVVHLAGPAFLPLALSLLLRKPVVIEHHGYQSICPNGLLLFEPDHSICPGHFMKGRYEMCVRCNAGQLGLGKSLRSLVLTFPRRWMCRMANRNIAVTNHVSRRIDLPQTAVVYHGIEETPISLALDDAGVDRTPLQIGCVGRLVAEKGIPILLRAAKRLDEEGVDYRLTIVGDGPERAGLEALARELAFREPVKFLGELHGDALANAVRSLQVVVMPSQWEETAGLSAIEQMMRGGVVVASDIGGLGEVVADAGLKFPPGDVEALYACLRRLIETPALRKSLGEAARRRAVQAFGRDSMIKAHISLYRELLTEPLPLDSSKMESGRR